MTDFTEEEATHLIQITNHQFNFWRQAIRDNTEINELQEKALANPSGKDDWKQPNYLYYWFILSYLRTQPDFRAPKTAIEGRELEPKEISPSNVIEVGPNKRKEVPGVIAGIGRNTARRYVGQVEKLELADRVGRRGLMLTKKGKQVVDDTLASWFSQFGAMYEEYLRRCRGGETS